MSPELLEVRRERALLLAAELSRETGVPVRDILSRDKDPETVAVRHRLWAMLNDAGMSLSVIGAVLDRDHTTIRAGVIKARQRAQERAA